MAEKPYWYSVNVIPIYEDMDFLVLYTGTIIFEECSANVGREIMKLRDYRCIYILIDEERYK